MKRIKYFENFSHKSLKKTNEAKCKDFSEIGYDIEHKKIEDQFDKNVKYDVYFGKNAESNDYLTTTYSGKNAVAIRSVGPSPNDIWMHASGLPGSHLIVKAINDDAIPEYVLIKAAEIAKKNSKAKDLEKSKVVFCKKDCVSKTLGSKTGEVLVDPVNRGYVIFSPGNEKVSYFS
jgi:predicted ribosome quality control (RQC) complex YloA/Tae2 family protein